MWYCRLSSPRNDRGTAGRQFIQYRLDCLRNSRAYTFSAIVIPKLIHLKGAGRGVHPDFLVELVFETAVVQKT